MDKKIIDCIKFASDNNLPIVITGDKSKATGKSTLKLALENLGLVVYEEYELGENKVFEKRDSNTGYIVISLNKKVI